MELDSFLRAHSYVNIERPPELWAADVEDTSFIHLTGEMLALALAQGNNLADLTLNVSNVVVPDDAADDDMRPGEFVAMTIKGRGRWEPDSKWSPRLSASDGLLRDLDVPMRAAGVTFAYVRDLGDEGGSITVFVPRLKAA